MIDLGDKLSDRDHRRIAEYIEHYAGIQLPDTKRSLIESRLRKRQRVTGHASLHDYVDMVLDPAVGSTERIYMLDALTTNKTDFYREPEHFRILKRYLSDAYKPSHGPGWERPLRVWSAGCSSGEEPYTLAMELLDFQDANPGFRFGILATDISVSCLQTARAATYAHSKVQPVPMDVRKRYLLRSRDASRQLVQMAPEVRETIEFRSFNLLTDAYEFQHRFDIIFCRNVMIYFNNDDRQQIARRFANCLTAEGLLFIGHSETLADKSTPFTQMKPTVYRNTVSLK